MSIVQMAHAFLCYAVLWQQCLATNSGHIVTEVDHAHKLNGTCAYHITGVAGGPHVSVPCCLVGL